jgi:hypothetical protein
MKKPKIFDDWHKVGRNKLDLFREVRNKSRVVIILFSQSKTTNEFNKYKAQINLGIDKVFPVQINAGIVHEDFDLFEPMVFGYGWTRKENRKENVWEKLVRASKLCFILLKLG